MGRYVTPCMGVWIETSSQALWLRKVWVTPCMGVWIETAEWLMRGEGTRSHPVWVCGLKQLSLNLDMWRACHTLYGCVDWNIVNSIVAKWCESHTLYGCVDWNKRVVGDSLKIGGHTLYGCVDWNDYTLCIPSEEWRSHPVWVCGLKHRCASACWWQQSSHPVWVCGLKLMCFFIQLTISRHTLYGCVDWNRYSPRWWRRQRVTPCMGVWIETAVADKGRYNKQSHTLYGCVDWNKMSSLSIG
mgnify:CR=1 FL=1